MKHDFKELRQQIPIMDICKLLGLQLRKTGGKYQGQCPICKRNAFKVTPSRRLWWCFASCDKGGDGLQLVMMAKGMRDIEAAEYIVKALGRPV